MIHLDFLKPKHQNKKEQNKKELDMNKEFEILSRAVIINDDKVLLVNVKGKNWHFLPGGHVEFGETATQALKREFEEETSGSKYIIKNPIGFFENIYDDTSHHQEYTILFEVEATNPEAIISNEEKLEFKFYKISELSTLDIRPDILIKCITDWHKNKSKFLSTEK